jgi:hypothetical protein
MAKKTGTKKTAKKAAPKLTKAATVAAGKAVGKSAKSTRKPAKPAVMSRMKARVVKVKQTLASKTKTVVHDAGLAAATAVGAVIGAEQAVKDLVVGNGKKSRR